MRVSREEIKARRAIIAKINAGRSFHGHAWAVYFMGSFLSGVYWTRREADDTRLAYIDGHMRHNSMEVASKFRISRRYWSSATQVARVSVVATPTHSPID